MSWMFREVGPEEGPAIESLLATADDYMIMTTGLPAAGGDTQGQFYEGLQYPGAEKRFIGAFSQSGKLGALIDLLLHFPEQEALAIALLYVHPSQRGKGAGRQALKHVEEIALDSGVNQLRIDNVPSGDPIASHLLSSCGWWPLTRENPDQGGLGISWHKKLIQGTAGDDSLPPMVRHFLAQPGVRARKIARYYEDELCDAYEAHQEAKFAGERLDTPAILEEIEGASTVYEIGAGSGQLMRDLLTRYPTMEYRGIDVSKPALARAKNRARKLGFESRAELIQADFRNSEVGSHGVDVALIAGCAINRFTGAEDLDALINHFASCVEANGRLLVSVVDDTAVEQFDQLRDGSALECLTNDPANTLVAIKSNEYNPESRTLCRTICFIQTEQTHVVAATAVVRERVWTPNEITEFLTRDGRFVLRKRIPAQSSRNPDAASRLLPVTLVFERCPGN